MPAAKKWIARVLTFVLIAYAALALVALFLAERVIFQPPPSSYDTPDFAFRRIPAGTEDSIAVLHLPHDTAHFTILFSHGNAEDLGHVRWLLDAIHRAGFGVVGYDYRGYGQSTGGRPAVQKAVADIDAVYRFATDELGIPPDRLILHGRSVGSGPTLDLAARSPAAGVILESAFTSTNRVLTRFGVLPFDRFPNFRHIAAIRAPVLVIHGTRDRIIPFSHGRRLFALAPEPKQSFWVENAGHNDVMLVAGDRYARTLREFAESIATDSLPTPIR